MITREQKFRLEAFLVLTSILFVGILAIFIGPKLKEKGDIYVINFREISVNGVNEGADVKYQGVKIGKVSSIDVNRDDLSSIILQVELKKGFPVKQDMRAKLQYLGITGLRFVELYGGKNSSDILEPGGEIPMGRGIGEKAEDLVVNIDSVVQAINKILDAENRGKISNTLSNIEKSSDVLARLLTKKEGEIGNVVDNLDKISGELADFSTKLKELTANINELDDKIKSEKLVENTGRVMRNLGDRLSKEEFGAVLKNFDRLVSTSSTSIKKIENSFYSLKSDLQNTFDSLKESMANIAKFTRDLAEDPTVLIRTRTNKRRKK